MMFAQALTRLRAATIRAAGARQETVEVSRADLAQLLLHFDRLDGAERARVALAGPQPIRRREAPPA
jgi:hypothetical protein